MISVRLEKIDSEMDATEQCDYTVRSLDINYLSERKLMSNKHCRAE